MDDLKLVVEGGEYGGNLVLEGVTILETNGVKVTIEDNGAVVHLEPGQKMTLTTERPEPR